MISKNQTKSGFCLVFKYQAQSIVFLMNFIKMNLAERIERLDSFMLAAELLTAIEAGDIPEYGAEKLQKMKQVGFCVA